MKFTCNNCKESPPCTYDIPGWQLDEDIYPECPFQCRCDWRYEGMPEDAPPFYDYPDMVTPQIIVARTDDTEQLEMKLD